MLSGLIRRPQPNQDLFDFVDELETRRWLVDQLRYGELLTVIERVSDYVSERLGRRLDLVALLRDPAGDLSVPEEALPFARLAQQALEVHGILPRRATGRVIEVRTLGRVQLHPFSFDTVTLDEQGQEIRRTTGEAWQFIEPLAEGVTLEMVRIDGGTFAMGSPPSEARRSDDEGPVREVTVPGFYLGKYPVTQAQWRIVAGWEKVEIKLPLDPSRFPENKSKRSADDDRRPVERVNWFQAREFCARLTRYTDRVYRLPSEAEWEYACRAGTTTPFAFGPTVTPAIVNYDGNYPYGKAPKGVYRGQTTPVGSLRVANPWGLYEMHGNVWEWCEDHAGPYKDAPSDGQPLIYADQTDGEERKRRLRGGSWNFLSTVCRSACRFRNGPGLVNHDLGLRVVVGARTLHP
jgi:formylglycine-generating enzyme required for sulfatase activity